ncbi:hypothetical protein Acr_00g0048520 [Actinidia rufa]|uniref:Uncharacterized protein n=1 Tax=Actinidia rufa TaxID=165716 RepID=A0A7J0DLL9_9ERIC|nr:hypothetical protein Acr_00g0048520 [Actinidia rufa]
MYNLSSPAATTVSLALLSSGSKSEAGTSSRALLTGPVSVADVYRMIQKFEIGILTSLPRAFPEEPKRIVNFDLKHK